MDQLALYTFGILKSPYASDDADIAAFRELGARIYGGMAEIDGHVRHATPDDQALGYYERGWGPWGEFTVPRWYTGGRGAAEFAAAATLSLWRDLASAREFVYRGLHRTALSRRREWFEKRPEPGLVLWWTAGDRTPTWADGVERIEELDASGAGPRAFTFAEPQSPLGTHPAA